MIWKTKHPNFDLGFLPAILWDSDPRPAKEQIQERYQHGGGWSPLQGFVILPDGRLQYHAAGLAEDDQDPPLELLAEGQLGQETLRFYEGSWMAVVQPDGSLEVTRMD
jgi:hypothetical protein